MLLMHAAMHKKETQNQEIMYTLDVEFAQWSLPLVGLFFCWFSFSVGFPVLVGFPFQLALVFLLWLVFLFSYFSFLVGFPLW